MATSTTPLPSLADAPGGVIAGASGHAWWRAKAAAMGVACTVLALAAAATAADLETNLAVALRHPGFRGALVGALVVGADGEEVLFERNADRPLVPASNVKILTAVAVLSLFGPAHRFTTRVYADALPDVAGGVDTLAVRGGGDPALTSEQWWRLAADLRRRGLRRVRGDLLLDDSRYDRQRWHPTWRGVSARAYHAPVGALAANYGSFAVEVQPGPRPGAPPRITVDPPVPYFHVVSRAKTTAPGKQPALSVARRRAAGREDVIVSGGVAAGSEAAFFYRSVADPVGYAGAVLRMQLEAIGIPVGGEVRQAPVPPRYPELLAFAGKPLAEIVRLFMKHSNNNIAESLLKAMGAQAEGEPGTWLKGVRAMRAELTSAGIDTAAATLVDGSGLSTENRLSPRTLAQALQVARDSFRFGPEFTASLPVAARDGTLEKRAAGARDSVRAKTGLLSGAAALSGYAETRDGVDLVFSVVANGYKGGDKEAAAALDAFAKALANSTVSSNPQPRR